MDNRQGYAGHQNTDLFGENLSFKRNKQTTTFSLIFLYSKNGFSLLQGIHWVILQKYQVEIKEIHLVKSVHQILKLVQLNFVLVKMQQIQNLIKKISFLVQRKSDLVHYFLIQSSTHQINIVLFFFVFFISIFYILSHVLTKIETRDWNEEFQELMTALQNPNSDFSDIFLRLSLLGNDFLYAAKVSLFFYSLKFSLTNSLSQFQFDSDSALWHFLEYV